MSTRHNPDGGIMAQFMEHDAGVRGCAFKGVILAKAILVRHLDVIRSTCVISAVAAVADDSAGRVDEARGGFVLFKGRHRGR